MISKEIWNQFSFWNCIICKTPGCQKPNNGLSKDASSHIKIVIFNLTQRLHCVQLGFYVSFCQNQKDREEYQSKQIFHLERLLSQGLISQTHLTLHIKCTALSNLCTSSSKDRKKETMYSYHDNSRMCHMQTQIQQKRPQSCIWH